MAKEEPIVEMIREQKRLEEDTMKRARELEGKVHNKAARLFLMELRLDSLRNATICQEILDLMEESVPENLWDERIESYVGWEAAKKAIEDHMLQEETRLKHIQEIIAKSRDEAIKLLFTHMVEDERKHSKNMELVIRRSYLLEP